MIDTGVAAEVARSREAEGTRRELTAQEREEIAASAADIVLDRMIKSSPVLPPAEPTPESELETGEAETPAVAEAQPVVIEVLPDGGELQVGENIIAVTPADFPGLAELPDGGQIKAVELSEAERLALESGVLPEGDDPF